jgi:hypothetical protein
METIKVTNKLYLSNGSRQDLFGLRRDRRTPTVVFCSRHLQAILVKAAFLCVRNFLLSRGGGGDPVFDTMAASAYVKMLQHYRVSSHGILVFFVQESKPTSIHAD